MGAFRLRNLMVFCGVGLALATGFFLFGQEENQGVVAQEEMPGDEPDLLERGRRGARVTVYVKDDRWSDIRVVSAALEGQDVRMKKHSNFFGIKGELKTNLPPGTYTIRWTVTKPAARKQRITLSFNKTFTIPRRDGSITITIEGQNATISL